jgi:hypothetical protein
VRVGHLDLEAGVDGIVQVRGPQEDPAVGALGDLELEVEDEVPVGLLGPEVLAVVLLAVGLAAEADDAVLDDPGMARLGLPAR